MRVCKCAHPLNVLVPIARGKSTTRASVNGGGRPADGVGVAEANANIVDRLKQATKDTGRHSEPITILRFRCGSTSRE